MTKLDWALAHGREGFYVLPLHWIKNGRCSCGKPDCPSPGKHPLARLVPRGFKDASNDPTTIEKWWGREPDANIGVATGQSGLVVLDVDGPEGQAQLKREGGSLPRTRVSRTGREGGFHLWYRGAVQSSQVKGEHLDVRGTTGYVVAPGSVHANGRVYEWYNNEPIGDVPAWVEPWVANRGGKTSRPTETLGEFPDPRARPSYLDRVETRSLADRALASMVEPWSAHAEACLRSALAAIPPDIDGKTWASFGAAIHDLGWPNGLDIWDDWSKTSKGKGAGNGEYRGRQDLEKRWKKFDQPYTGQRVTVASIYHMATKNGWTGNSADNSSKSNVEDRCSDQGEQGNKTNASEALPDNADESQSSSDDALIDELASLSIIAYAKRRKEAAKQLGIGVTKLDKAVERRRVELEGEARTEPSSFLHWTVDPWPEPVDGDALILALVRRIESHVVMTRAAVLTVALWIIFAWVHEEVAVHSPILMITSPEPECGKTTLLGLISLLVPRSLASVGISPAALFRAIEKWGPTLMIDEADVAFAQNDDLRAVVNSGWTRGQGVVRCDGDDNEPRLFSTFCPKAIGLKGKKLPDTTASRAIVIELKRKFAHENVADFRHIDDSELQESRRHLLRWAVDHAEALREASPTLPPGFANRLAANWHLLLAIAETAGGEWPEKALEAAATIAKLKATLDASIGIQLLSDIRAAFGSGTDRLFSSTLIDKLTSDPEGTWAGYNRGRPFTQKQLASRLRDYGILSETVWIDGKSAKGYKRAAFEDVWTRYLEA